MAQIVAGFGVPHTPIFPHFVKRDGPDCEIARLFARAEGAACRDPAGHHRDVRHRSSQHVLPRQPADLRARHRQEFPGAQRRAARRAGLRGAVGSGPCRPHPRGRRRRRLRRRHDAELFGRPFGDRAAAFPHPGHEGSGDPVLHQRPRAAATACATLPCARTGSRPRHRVVAGEQARRGDGQRQLLARSRRPAHGAGPLRRRARSGLGDAGDQVSRTAADRHADQGIRPSIRC